MLQRRSATGPRKTRAPLHLSLTTAEICALEAWAASELRSVSNAVSYLLAEHLRTRRGLVAVEAPKGKRQSYTAQVWLTAKQRQELQRRAGAEMRAVANYATAVVVRVLIGKLAR